MPKANSAVHTKWTCKYHIVFTPKYRRKIIYNQYKADLARILHDLCAYKGVEILERHLMPDHVHMLVSIPPCVIVYGISEGKKFTDDVRQTWKLEIQVWKQTLLVRWVLCKYGWIERCDDKEVHTGSGESRYPEG